MRYHGKTPSYRWRNEGILPGFQVAGISRRLEVHDPFSGDAQAMAVETALTLVTDQARMSTRCRSMVGWLRMRHRGKGYDDTSSLARCGSSGKWSVALLGTRDEMQHLTDGASACGA